MLVDSIKVIDDCVNMLKDSEGVNNNPSKQP